MAALRETLWRPIALTMEDVLKTKLLFPDGGYCDLESFYREPVLAKYYEDALWMLEAYTFLYGDFTPYGQYYVPGTGYSYYANPYANQLSNPYWNSDLGSSYYWPVYAQG